MSPTPVVLLMASMTHHMHKYAVDVLTPLISTKSEYDPPARSRIAIATRDSTETTPPELREAVMDKQSNTRRAAHERAQRYTPC